jgi:hypothetical protein
MFSNCRLRLRRSVLLFVLATEWPADGPSRRSSNSEPLGGRDIASAAETGADAPSLFIAAGSVSAGTGEGVLVPPLASPS